MMGKDTAAEDSVATSCPLATPVHRKRAATATPTIALIDLQDLEMTNTAIIALGLAPVEPHMPRLGECFARGPLLALDPTAQADATARTIPPCFGHSETEVRGGIREGKARRDPMGSVIEPDQPD